MSEYIIDPEMIKVLRADLGLSQREFSEFTGIRGPVISVLESGQRNMSLKFLFKYARALGKKPSEVLASIESK